MRSLRWCFSQCIQLPKLGFAPALWDLIESDRFFICQREICQRHPSERRLALGRVLFHLSLSTAHRWYSLRGVSNRTCNLSWEISRKPPGCGWPSLRFPYICSQVSQNLTNHQYSSKKQKVLKTTLFRTERYWEEQSDVLQSCGAPWDLPNSHGGRVHVCPAAWPHDALPMHTCTSEQEKSRYWLLPGTVFDSCAGT